MNRSLVLFLASAAAGAMTATPILARAGSIPMWSRTIRANALSGSSNACTSRLSPTKNTFACAFPSDTVDGNAMNVAGNRATGIYADYVASSPGTWQFSACAEAYNASGGACGATVSGTVPGSGLQAFTASVPLWIGTNSRWDYFSLVGSGNYKFSLIGFRIFGS
jgi:hypothetical protein